MMAHAQSSIWPVSGFRQLSMSMPVYGSESVKTKPIPVNDHR